MQNFIFCRPIWLDFFCVVLYTIAHHWLRLFARLHRYVKPHIFFCFCETVLLTTPQSSMCCTKKTYDSAWFIIRHSYYLDILFYCYDLSRSSYAHACILKKCSKKRDLPRCFIVIFTHIFFTLHKKWSFSNKGFFSKCEQIRRKLHIWSHLLKKP